MCLVCCAHTTQKNLSWFPVNFLLFLSWGLFVTTMNLYSIFEWALLLACMSTAWVKSFEWLLIKYQWAAWSSSSSPPLTEHTQIFYFKNSLMIDTFQPLLYGTSVENSSFFRMPCTFLSMSCFANFILNLNSI